ncbi:MAG: dodecin family protein [Phycisphaerae bacterium]
MSVAKVIEITAQSDQSFEDAINQGIGRAAKKVDNVQSAWIKEQKVDVKDGKVSAYRVDMKVTFLLNE